MDAEKTKKIITEIDKLDLEDKKEIYRSCFAVGYLATDNLNDRLILFSLLSLTYQKMKLQDKNITPLSLLCKITGQKADNSAFYQFLVSLSLLVEDLSYGIKNIDACGLKTSQEIVKRIKDLLNTWIPF